MSELLRWSNELLKRPDDAAYRIYERSKQDQWRIEAVIDWDALSLRSLPAAVRRCMARIYAQIHFGELFSLTEAARAMSSVGHPWSGMLLATQVTDETRHTEFFSRLLVELDQEATVHDRLLDFAEDVRASKSTEAAFLGTQILLESFALSIFREGASLARETLGRTVRLPHSQGIRQLLRVVGHYVARDEARHVGHGIRYLQRRWSDMSAMQRAALENDARRWMSLLDGLLEELGGDLKLLGVDPSVIRRRTQQMRSSHFRMIDMHYDPGPVAD